MCFIKSLQGFEIFYDIYYAKIPVIEAVFYGSSYRVSCMRSCINSVENPIEMAAIRPTLIFVKLKCNSRFSKHVTKNIDGAKFIARTPFKIKKDFRLAGVGDIDVRNKSKEEIEKILKNTQSKFGKTVTLKVLNPAGPKFEEFLNCEEVSLSLPSQIRIWFLECKV